MIRFKKPQRYLLVVLSLMVSIFLPLGVEAAEKHPDGLVGQINGSFEAAFTSVAAENNVPHTDRFQFGLDLAIPAANLLTVMAGYQLENVDSVFHHYFVALKVYPGNPLVTRGHANPDGVIGLPVFSLGYGGRVPDRHVDNHQYVISGSALVPVMKSLSLGIGGNYYQDRELVQVDEYYGMVNFFTGSYLPGEEYSNPDGVEGTPSFYLRAGGSSDGFFGQMDILMPLKQNLTLVLNLRGQRTPSPYTRSARIGIRINYYPGR
nr:hypothetical protein [candidate division Zixibacteria bacterium]